MELKKQIGDRVKASRRRASLSQAELAEKCGVSVAAISLIERGETLPSIDTLAKITTALGHPLMYFFMDFERTGARDQQHLLLSSIHAILMHVNNTELERLLRMIEAMYLEDDTEDTGPKGDGLPIRKRNVRID